MKLTEDFETYAEAEERVKLLGTGIAGSISGDDGAFVKYDPAFCGSDVIHEWMKTAVSQKYARVYGWSYSCTVTLGAGYEPNAPEFSIGKQANGTYTVTSRDEDHNSNLVAILENEDKLLAWIKTQARDYFGL